MKKKYVWLFLLLLAAAIAVGSRTEVAGFLRRNFAATFSEVLLEVNKTKRQNSPTLKNSQKFVKWGQWFNTRSNSEKVINFEFADFLMYRDVCPKIDASFL